MRITSQFFALASLALALTASSRSVADPLSCSMTGYRAEPGLVASFQGDTLTATWQGDKDDQVRLQIAIEGGVPTIRDLSIKPQGGRWFVVAGEISPEFRVVSGYRRMDFESLEPLEHLGVPITPAILEKDKWEAFWDAPLMVPGTEAGGGHAKPPTEGIASQPGLPRKPEEVTRAIASYSVRDCEVKTDGMRIEMSFPGVTLGVFSGKLQYTVYKGTNLIRQEVIAKTDEASVAYKYDAGFKGLKIDNTSQVVWRDVANIWQNNELGGAVEQTPTVLQANNRIVAVQTSGGSLATFPPPHNFFWSREIDLNLGYDWLRKDSESSYAFGVREAETEADPRYAGRGPQDYRENFALRNARPGTWQRMPVYLYVSSKPAQDTLDAALMYTRNDHYKALPGYKVMATHFHAGLAIRYERNGRLQDFEVVKGAGINIYAPIDGSGSGGGSGGGTIAAGGDRLKDLGFYYDIARRYSDRDFVVMPNEEIAFGELTSLGRKLGGHKDILISHPVFWVPERADGQPLVQDDPNYGKVYHIGGPSDLIEMAHREDLILYMPHPRSKGSQGYPDAMKDGELFRDPNWRGIGFRWGMGVDGSEQRLCEYRCLPTWDDMNNWVADLPTPPKFLHAIAEVEQVGYGDDIYANTPVNYIKLDALPGLDNWKPIVDAMKQGDYFVTSGEVLIPKYAVEGNETKRTIVADVEWTFPLEFVEVVWGNGAKTDRQIISATDLPAFGKHHFEIPFDTTGKKWVRFAVWDSAGDGAMVQPIKLTTNAN